MFTLVGFILKDTVLLNGFSAKYLYLHFISDNGFSDRQSISDGNPVFSMVYRGDHESLLSLLSVGSKYDIKFFYDKKTRSCICTEVISSEVKE